MAEGAWIFLSHSNKDFDRVSQQVRNRLERHGHHPLMFFLKCLSQEDDRLPRLIEDEIKARHWFVLCDSASARASAWVQREVDIIKGLDPATHTYVEIDLDAVPDWGRMDALRKKATVFLVSDEEDGVLARRVRTRLQDQDFGVFTTLRGDVTEPDWFDRFQQAAGEGTIVPILGGGDGQPLRREFLLQAIERLSGPAARHVRPVVTGEPERLLREARHLRQAEGLLREGVYADARTIDDAMPGLMETIRASAW